jgi:hypothetical protein
MEMANGVPLSPRQEKEAALAKRLVAELGWEIESIHPIPNSTALEYKLQGTATRKDGSRMHHSIQGANTFALTEEQLVALINRQLKAAA